MKMDEQYVVTNTIRLNDDIKDKINEFLSNFKTLEAINKTKHLVVLDKKSNAIYFNGIMHMAKRYCQ